MGEIYRNCVFTRAYLLYELPYELRKGLLLEKIVVIKHEHETCNMSISIVSEHLLLTRFI